MRYEVVDTPEGQRQLKHDLQALFLDCYGKRLHHSRWNELYLSPPDGCAISIAAFDDEGLAGHYAVIPMVVENEHNETRRLARGMTLCVAERARTKGVMAELLKRIKQPALERDLFWTIGFPNDLSWRPLVLFCGWQVLYESAVRTFDSAGASANDVQVRRAWYMPPDGFAPQYVRPEYHDWRTNPRDFYSFVVNESLVVVAKILGNDTLDVMDLWPFRPVSPTDPSDLWGLVRWLDLHKICITDHHARLAGLISSKGTPTGYTVRMAVMPNDSQPPPELHFSLLFSDVY